MRKSQKRKVFGEHYKVLSQEMLRQWRERTGSPASPTQRAFFVAWVQTSFDRGFHVGRGAHEAQSDTLQ